MDDMIEREPVKNAPVKDVYAREKVFLSNSVQKDLVVVPGKKWGFHYPNGSDARQNVISGLLQGEISVEEATLDLKPDAVTYDAKELESNGFQSVSARVKDIASFVENYDYLRFALFVSSLQGTGVTAGTAQMLYDGIVQSRVRKQMLDAYGSTGRRQIENAIRKDAENLVENIDTFQGADRVLSALKIDWMTENSFALSEQRQEILEKLSEGEHEFYNKTRDLYREFARIGSEESFDALIDRIKEHVKIIQSQEIEQESQAKLEEELEPYIEDAAPPVTPDDPSIPPEDSDEYYTSEEFDDNERIYFEISPSGSSTRPLGGYYASGRKSYYDIHSRTWSKRKEISSYTSSVLGVERQSISGITSIGLKSLPIPNGYAVDFSSLRFAGEKPEIFRDQNGCFYIKANGVSNFSIDFLKENPVFVSRPVAEDIVPIHKGELSQETERFMSGLQGSDMDKAERVRQHLLSKHFYPGDGDLQMAQALQLKLRKVSTEDNYIQNLDNSEYLECYSANTFYAAILRKIGVPTRLVVGHHVQRTTSGESQITSKTGHAWAEVWDGVSWRRMDATPKPKNQKQDQQDNSDFDMADDGGIDVQLDGDGIGDISDQDIELGLRDLDNAKDFSKEIEGNKRELDQRIEDAESFEDLKDLIEESGGKYLFDDMRQDLEDRLDSKEEQIKTRIKDDLDEMADDGFLDDERRQELERELEEGGLEDLDEVVQVIKKESSHFNEYQEIREEVMPLVDDWFGYFVDRLPKEDTVETDEDSLTRQGSFNRHSVMKPRNLLFGTVKNPRMIKPNIKPKFLASVVVDVSRSMGLNKAWTEVDLTKINNARKLLVFYNELFSRIGGEYGYIRFSNSIFSDTVTELKSYDQDYNSSERFDWEDGSRSTVKARIMEEVHAHGLTDMLPAIQKVAEDLNTEIFEYPDYASALYFIGDGEDTSGNADKVREFLKLRDSEEGFGEHMLSAIMLGDEDQRRELADIFGDEHTTVASDFETLIEQSMHRFDEDIQDYLRDKTL